MKELSDNALLALREIVLDWIGDGFTTPPYSPEQYDIFEWLGIYGEAGAAGYNVDRPE